MGEHLMIKYAELASRFKHEQSNLREMSQVDVTGIYSLSLFKAP
jgi:hypothetical protein